MNLLRNIVAVLLGLVLGSAVNMAFIIFGPTIIPPPEGVDVSTMEGLKANIHLFEPKHFLFPFLAHGLGTFVGALIAVNVAKTHQCVVCGCIALAFLAGGIFNIMSLPAPMWFEVSDLVLAYIPMGLLAFHLWKKRHGDLI